MLAITLALTGCCNPPLCLDRHYVRDRIANSIGILPQEIPPCREVIPANVALDDGLSEFEAVDIALANNSAFQASLAQLGMAGGDAIQASLIANPQLLVYFPTGAKEGQATLYAPIESYLLRPTRMRIANRDYHRIGDTLVQNGLNVARDVRLAYADYALAIERFQLAQDASRIRNDIADLTNNRFKNGDISELETITSRVDALNAGAMIAAEQHNVNIARARLVTWMGIPSVQEDLLPEGLKNFPVMEFEESELIAIALACRPALEAAKWQVAAAQERQILARRLFWRIDFGFDSRLGQGYQRTGTGLRLDLPIFNRNQGGIVRADWELNAAQHNQDAVSDQIQQEVRVSMQQFEQAEENLAVIEREMLPKLTEAIAIAERGFADGGTDYLLVLQTTTQYLDARSRALIERANRQRARAELERSISRSLSESPLVPSLNELKTTSQNRDLEAISTETDRTIESKNP